MITDFPEARKEILKSVNRVLRTQVREKAPMFALFRTKFLHEGDSVGVLLEDGRHVVNPLQVAESRFSVSQEDALTMKREELLSKVDTMAEDMASQMERGFFQAIDHSARESGSVVSSNQELGPESILAAYQRIQIDFQDDDRSKPILPTVVCSPETFQKLKDREAQPTEAELQQFRRKLEAILDEEYRQHLADLSSRRLTD